MKRTHPVNLATVLDNIVESQQMSLRLAERRAVAAWSEAVGGTIAQRATAVDAINGVLMIKCNQPVMRQEIMMASSSLLNHLNRACGKEILKSIRFV